MYLLIVIYIFNSFSCDSVYIRWMRITLLWAKQIWQMRATGNGYPSIVVFHLLNIGIQENRATATERIANVFL